MYAQFWTIKKRLNSTYVPSETPPQVEVRLKSDCSDYRPTLILQGYEPSSNYFYLYPQNRYYFIEDIVHRTNNTIEITGVCDVLATYREQILSKSVYVERSQSHFALSIPDNTMVATQRMGWRQNTAKWFDVPANTGAGQFVLCVLGASQVSFTAVNADSVLYYVVTSENMIKFREWAFNQGSYGSTTSDDVVKSFFNPFEYVISCLWYPFEVYEYVAGVEEGIRLGWFQSDAKGMPLSRTIGRRLSSIAIPIPRANNEQPMEFINFAPYSRYKLYCPYCGVIEISPTSLVGSTYIVIEPFVDTPTGKLILHVFGSKDVGAANDMLIARMDGQLGSPTQLGQTTVDIMGFAKSSGGAITSAMNFTNPLGALTGAISNLMDAAQAAWVPQADKIGSMGAKIESMALNAFVLQLQYVNVSPGDISEMGRPLCEEGKLSDFSGYVKCANASVGINSAFLIEEEQINNYLNTGFFIE